MLEVSPEGSYISSPRPELHKRASVVDAVVHTFPGSTPSARFSDSHGHIAIDCPHNIRNKGFGCRRCGEMGLKVPESDKEAGWNLVFRECGEKGHTGQDCPKPYCSKC